MSKVELVIFDMDGLIFDTEILSYNAWLKAAEEHSINHTMELHHKLLGKNSKTIRNILTEQLGDEILANDYADAKAREYLAIINNEKVNVKAGLHELLKYLKDNNIKRAVATSSRRDIAYKLLKGSNIFDEFNYVLCGDEVTNSKPDPEIFLNVAKKFDIPSENCIVLEDSEAGILAAHRANMRGIVIPDMKDPNEETLNIAYKKLENLEQVINIISNINK